MRATRRRLLIAAAVGALAGACVVPLVGAAVPATAQQCVVQFSTNAPDGRLAMASRPSSGGKIEIEAADDFLLTSDTHISNASFTGLLPSGDPLSDVADVVVEIYHVFPVDSVDPPSGNVPTRANSPSDTAFAQASETGGTLSFTATTLVASFNANNSVLNGINKIPHQFTGGEGPVTGAEVRFDVTFNPGLDLTAGHYFFVPQVRLTSSGNFFWLSSAHPVVSPGTPFSPDLQAWIRNSNLAPDWLRVGTDIIGGATPPTFNGVFALTGTTCPTGPSPGSATGPSPTTIAPLFTG